MPRCVVLIITTKCIERRHFGCILSVNLFVATHSISDPKIDRWEREGLDAMSVDKKKKQQSSYHLSILGIISFKLIQDFLNLIRIDCTHPNQTACITVSKGTVVMSRFWMSFICCFISVLSIMCVNTVIQYMPLIFLMEAEESQSDARYFCVS